MQKSSTFYGKGILIFQPCKSLQLFMFLDINSILSRATKKSGIKSELKASECISLFAAEAGRCLGDELAKKIKPLYVKDAVITIASLSDIAVQELNKYEQEILLKINASLGEKYVKEIRYLS
jgi:predicted nucleic acid-binding Zn ribbon protein